MKHIFVVNPMSGQRKAVDFIKTELEKYKDKIDCQLYITKGIGDAEKYINDYLKSHNEKVRFYACGGDGTINEAVNGTAPFPHASLAVCPCGSGNDFVKTFGSKEDFPDIGSLINGTEIPIDIMKVNNRYCVNVCNFGFDSYVAKKMNEIRSKPLIGGKNAYTTGVILGLVKAMKNNASVIADGEKMNSGTLLLCTVANGRYVGGKYKCAPKAIVNDGLLEICLVKPVSRITFIRLVNAYAEGQHLEDSRFKKFVRYKRCKKVEIIADDKFIISIDGEIFTFPHTNIEIIPKGLSFVLPKKLLNCDSLM